MKTERGTILKIEIDVQYPSGVQKHVTFSDDPSDAVHNHYMLSEIAGMFFGQDDLIDHMVQVPIAVQTQNVRERWNNISEGDSYHPAMVVLQKNGTVLVMCGGHNNGPHPVRAKAKDVFAIEH